MRIVAIILAFIWGTPAFASEPTVRDCSVMYVENTSAGDQRRMRVFASTTATDGMDRVATAKWISLGAIAYTGFHYVDVFLMPAEGTKDRDEMDGYSAAVFLKHAPDPDRIPFMDVVWAVKYAGGPPKDGGYWAKDELDSDAVEAVMTSERKGECDPSVVPDLLIR